ncbi:unnamed protein product [Sphagnum tenellum]
MASGRSANTETTTSLSVLPKDESLFPRSEQQQADYDRQMQDYNARAMLLNTASLQNLTDPRYLATKLSIMPAVCQVIDHTLDNIAGWLSIQLDPSEEGSPGFIRRLEHYAMAFAGSADISSKENYLPAYSANLSDFTLQANSSAFTMSVSKVYPDKFALYGASVSIKDFYAQQSINPTSSWQQYPEEIVVPTAVPYLNVTRCTGKPFTLLTAIYPFYGMMAPIRRNPANLHSPNIKIDSKVISVQLTTNPDPATDNPGEDFSDCEVDTQSLKYTPVQIRFYHLDPKTTIRKLLWHKNELTSDIEMRLCAAYNPDLGKFGGWDTSNCTTVITEQDSTLCECGIFGTFAVIAEMVEEPYVGPEQQWLTIVKYGGYVISLVMLLAFVRHLGHVPPAPAQLGDLLPPLPQLHVRVRAPLHQGGQAPEHHLRGAAAILVPDHGRLPPERVVRHLQGHHGRDRRRQDMELRDLLLRIAPHRPRPDHVPVRRGLRDGPEGVPGLGEPDQVGLLLDDAGRDGGELVA